MTPSAEYMNQPFELAIKFFKNKVNLPTENWDDLWKGMHARAFVVAGAMKSELLCDLRSAVDKAIFQGTTLDEFRKDFDALVDRHGWSYKGGRKWRSAVIYNTNLSVAYATGHYQAMQEVKDLRPFWRYVPSSSKTPRDDHKQWYNTVLPADDPFWDTHYPQNDWGCKCGVTNHSARDIERLKKKFEGTEFPISETRPQGGTYEWKDRSGNTHTIPEGIGKGWDYNPGKAAWGETISKKAMAEWQVSKDRWERLTEGNWLTNGLPEMIPADPVAIKKGAFHATTEETALAIKELIGGDEKAIVFEEGDFRHVVVINANTLARHIKNDRTPYLPMMIEALSSPYEIWQTFERHTATGEIVLRQRFIKILKTEKKRGMIMVVQSNKGVMEAWTTMPVSRDFKYLNKQRSGKLVWRRSASMEWNRDD